MRSFRSVAFCICIVAFGTLTPALAVAQEEQADVEQPNVVRARFTSSASAREIAEQACALRGAFESGGRGWTFDVSVDDARCSSLPVAQDAVAMRVQTEASGSSRIVTLEAESKDVPAEDLQRAVNRTGLALKAALVRQVARRQHADEVTTSVSDWKKGDPVPDGYHEASRPRIGLIIGGASVFGAAYIPALLGAAASGGSASWLYVPIVGPFVLVPYAVVTGIFLGPVGWLLGAALVIDGVAQATGLALLVYGLASPKTVLVRNVGALKNVTPFPLVGPNMAGLGVVGRF